MAESGTVIVDERKRQKKLDHIVTVVLNGSGTGQTVINLSATFTNSPEIKVFKPLGGAGTYAGTYDSATPKITVDVTTDTAFLSKTVEANVVAYDPM